MLGNREMALEIALRSVLVTAQTQGVDLDSLCETAADDMLSNPSYDVLVTPEAICAIEVAIDALPVTG